jgi:hypothetical protein
MGKVFLLGLAITIGYSLGYRDARAHPKHILARAVDQVKVTFHAKPANDIDAVMSKVEGKN